MKKGSNAKAFRRGRKAHPKNKRRVRRGGIRL